MVRYRPALQEGKKPGRGSLSSPIVNNHYIIRLIWSTVLCPETMPSHLATAAANSELWPAMPLKWNAWSDRRNTRLLPETPNKQHTTALLSHRQTVTSPVRPHNQHHQPLNIRTHRRLWRNTDHKLQKCLYKKIPAMISTCKLCVWNNLWNKNYLQD